MSIAESFFGKSFSGAKCKTLITLTISRIKLLKNKRELQLKQMEKDIVHCLQSGQETTAQIRVEHVIREQNILAAYAIIELFCEHLGVRLHIIETQRECPLDLREAVATLIFAAPRCSDLPELLHIRNLFVAKYGKDFVTAIAELKPNCGVNRQIIEKLSAHAPVADLRLKTLKNIAKEYNILWDSTATESEIFKLHEDLLDGSSHFLKEGNAPILQKNESAYRVENPTSRMHPVEQMAHGNSTSGDQKSAALEKSLSKLNVSDATSNSTLTVMPRNSLSKDIAIPEAIEPKNNPIASSQDVMALAQTALAKADRALAAARIAANLVKDTCSISNSLKE
eukprot:TRINITY_DN2509_c0_g1_i1.p1 TRINITY_DN2509_c0_g1~~TRINITY_DN2509_c0_g1_i1.p1  ORF type:complete len:339 (-),score=66.20 TRINITY_DN2509_c0_g1_i1:22-1038(-)